MITKVDWLSFSVKFARVPGSGVGDTRAFLVMAINDLDERLFDDLEMGEDVWDRCLSRKPYRNAVRHRLSGATIMWHDNLDHALVELSGQSCNYYYSKGVLYSICRAIAPRVTRVDVAADIETNTRPGDFVKEREEGRFKAHSEFVSQSGETCYVGSRSSQRYCRVYRYNEPHERAHLLRCEFVSREETARLTLEALMSDGIEAVCASLGTKFGFKHKDWTPDTTNEAELRSWRPERHKGKTEFWLANTVAPLLVRLAREGGFNPTEWLKTHVLDKI